MVCAREWNIGIGFGLGFHALEGVSHRNRVLSTRVAGCVIPELLIISGNRGKGT
jgi:hypothetical protein